MIGPGRAGVLAGRPRPTVTSWPPQRCRSASAPRERLFREGTRAEGCWLIHDGCVALDLAIPAAAR